MLNANQNQLERTRHVAIELDGVRGADATRALADSERQKALRRARSRDEMFSASPFGTNVNANVNVNVNVNANGNSSFGRNIREAAILVQNGYNHHANGAPPGLPQKVPPPNGVRLANTPGPQRAYKGLMPNGTPAPANKPAPAPPAPMHPALASRPANPAYPPGVAFNAAAPLPGYSTNVRSVNGHAPTQAPPVQPAAQTQPLAPPATRPANSAPVRNAQATALQKSLQQQVERFIQQQAAQQNGRPVETQPLSTSASSSTLSTTYTLPASSSASSLGQLAPSANGAQITPQNHSSTFRLTNGPNTVTAVRAQNGQPPVPSSQQSHLTVALGRPEQLPPASAVDSVLMHLHAAAIRTGNQQQQLSPTAQTVDSHSSLTTQTHPVLSSSQPTGWNALSNASRPANDTAPFSVAASRNVRPTTAANASTTAGQTNNAATSERNRPFIYAPRSVIADTYLKQERRSDSTVQAQRFLDMMNRIRMQQAHQAGVHAALSNLSTNSHNGESDQPAAEPGRLTVSGALAQTAMFSTILQPDYNYVVDHVDKVHIRINTPRSVHRRASITDSAEDLRRISDALVLSSSQFAPMPAATAGVGVGFGAPVNVAPGITQPLPVSLTTPGFALSLSALGTLNGSDTEEGASNSSKSDSISQSAMPASVRTQFDEPIKPRSILRTPTSADAASSETTRHTRNVRIDPLALLLDAALEGELEVVRQMCELTDPSAPNDEGITALHNAVCAGHVEICRFLVQSAAANVNAADADGWTPLHCAASCNNLEIVRLLVEHGACLSSTTTDEFETPLDKCEAETHISDLDTNDLDVSVDLRSDNDAERDLANEIDTVRLSANTNANTDTTKRTNRHSRPTGYRGDSCREYLLGVVERLGVANDGRVFALFDHDATNADELSISINQELLVVRRSTDDEWWLVRNRDGREGYVPRAYLGLHPRILK